VPVCPHPPVPGRHHLRQQSQDANLEATPQLVGETGILDIPDKTVLNQSVEELTKTA